MGNDNDTSEARRTHTVHTYRSECIEGKKTIVSGRKNVGMGDDRPTRLGGGTWKSVVGSASG
jgi:hypothetical protein